MAISRTSTASSTSISASPASSPSRPSRTGPGIWRRSGEPSSARSAGRAFGVGPGHRRRARNPRGGARQPDQPRQHHRQDAGGGASGGAQKEGTGLRPDQAQRVSAVRPGESRRRRRRTASAWRSRPTAWTPSSPSNAGVDAIEHIWAIGNTTILYPPARDAIAQRPSAA